MESALYWRPSANPTDRKRIQPESLLHYCKNVFSQRGDDGIAAEIFRRIGIEKGFFVEFGGWDGVFLANSRALFQAGWDGAFIEADAEKFKELEHNYQSAPNILCINEWVGIPGRRETPIDEIAAKYFPRRSIDYMTIDIDGLDYRILETMTLRPKVICIEGGFAFHPLFTQRVPDEVAARNISQPLAVMIDVGRAAGYTPVCFNQNVFLVLDELAAPFHGIRKDAMTLWRDAWFNESETFRESIVRFRSRNQLVRTIEGPRFAALPSDMMAGIGHAKKKSRGFFRRGLSKIKRVAKGWIAG